MSEKLMLGAVAFGLGLYFLLSGSAGMNPPKTETSAITNPRAAAGRKLTRAEPEKPTPEKPEPEKPESAKPVSASAVEAFEPGSDDEWPFE